jgi:hypothetical protein
MNIKLLKLELLGFYIRRHRTKKLFLVGLVKDQYLLVLLLGKGPGPLERYLLPNHAGP